MIVLKQLLLVAISLMLSTTLHLGALYVSGFLTLFLVGKGTLYIFVWPILGFATFFFCGRLLASTNGLQYPRITSPLGAVLGPASIFAVHAYQRSLDVSWSPILLLPFLAAVPSYLGATFGYERIDPNQTFLQRIDQETASPRTGEDARMSHPYI